MALSEKKRALGGPLVPTPLSAVVEVEADEAGHPPPPPVTASAVTPVAVVAYSAPPYTHNPLYTPDDAWRWVEVGAAAVPPT